MIMKNQIFSLLTILCLGLSFLSFSMEEEAPPALILANMSVVQTSESSLDSEVCFMFSFFVEGNANVTGKVYYTFHNLDIIVPVHGGMQYMAEHCGHLYSGEQTSFELFAECTLTTAGTFGGESMTDGCVVVIDGFADWTGAY